MFLGLVDKVSHLNLILWSHNVSKRCLTWSNQLEAPIAIVTIHDFEFQGLVFFEIIANNEALLEVGIEIILDFFCAPIELPMTLFRICLIIQKAHRVRYPLSYSVYIFEFAALDEKLHFVT